MKEPSKHVLYWTPRILCLAFAAFLSIFAIDVFGMPFNFWQKMHALFMHLIPTWVVLAVLALVWRREWVGALLFPLLAVVHLATKWGQLDWSAYVMIEGPLVLLGIFFWFNWQYRGELRPSAR